MASAKSSGERERAGPREQRSRDVLDAGMRLFVERGLAEVDMKEVATAAGVSRATLYRYFPSKKALAYEILRHLASEMLALEPCNGEQPPAENGYEKFARFVDRLLQALQSFPDFLRFLGAFDHYSGYRDDPRELAQAYLDAFGGLLVGDPPHLHLAEGQQDGSVRQNIAPRAYAAMTIEGLVNLAQHIAARGEMLVLLYGLETPGELLDSMARAFLRGARP